MKEFKDQSPLPNETCVVTDSTKLKQAALFFDKIYISRLDLESNEEIDVPNEITIGERAIDLLIRELHTQLLMAYIEYKKRRVRNPEVAQRFENNYYRLIIDSYRRKGIILTPIYSRADMFESDFPQGDENVWQAVMNNIDCIDYKKVTWNKIFEIRKDKKSQKNIRELKYWLRSISESGSVQQTTDIIENKIREYKLALKKHGIDTIRGIISTVIDPRLFAAAVYLDNVLNIPSLITGGLALTARISIELKNRALAKKNIDRDAKEIAYIIEILKLK